MPDQEVVQVSSIQTSGRIRGDLGDIDTLATSIRENGLIQPIVLVRELTMAEALVERNSYEPAGWPPSKREGSLVVLVAGGRRLTAIKKLGWTELIHAKHFIWRDEILTPSNPEIRLKMQAIEIEENVRRKDLTWQEQVIGQQKLLAIMQEIHGPAKTGGITRGEKYHGEVRGFGTNKLAAMLGISPATVSKNITLANAIAKAPVLAKASTAEAARRQISTLSSIITMQRAGVAAAVAASVHSVNDQTKQETRWKLYEGDTLQNIKTIEAESVDLIYTDLPFGVALSEMSKHQGGVVGYADSRQEVVDNLEALGRESFRILAPDRYAVFWFGFNYYTELLSTLQSAGFKVSVVPFVWFKNSRSTENPNVRYGNSYDPAIIAMKGSPVFIRPGQQNFFSFPQPTGADKLQVAQQPVELVTRFLQDMVVPGALVCDLTAGSGTTGVAAVKFGCRAVMFEKEPAACAIIKARMGILK